MRDAMNECEERELVKGAEEAEATLRMVASMAAPGGLEGRIKAALKGGAQRGRVLAWKNSGKEPRGWLQSAAMRGLAAAAIVGIVAGGGWGVASYGRHSATPKRITLPRLAAPGGFSSAGAMRTPQTLHPPAVPPARAKEERRKGRAGEAKSAERHLHKKAAVRMKTGHEKAGTVHH